MSLMRDSEDATVHVDLAELKEELSKNGIVICPTYGCNQDFKSIWGLKYHLKQGNHQTAGERRFKCEQCNLLFQSRVNLRQHRITDHSGSESGSPLSSPLLSSSSKEKDTFQFAPLLSTVKDKTTKIKQKNKDGNNSCRGANLRHEVSLDESGSKTRNEFNETVQSASEKSNKSGDLELEDSAAVHDENGSKTTGAAKRKRGRPRKTRDRESSDNTTSETSHLRVTFNSYLPDQLGEMSSSSQAKTKNDLKKTSPSCVTARRTSTRVRTPRKNFYIDVDTAKNESLHSSSRQRGIKRKGSKGNKSGGENETDPSKKKTPKKRGRKPKKTDSKNDNNVSIQDCDYDMNVSETMGEKNRRGNRDVDDNVHDLIKIDNDVDNSNVQEENEDSYYHGGHDDSDDHDDDGGNNDDSDDDDDDDDDDEIDKSCTPKKRTTKKQLEKKGRNKNGSTAKKKQGRKKLPAPSEAVLLKRRLNAGQKLTCKNKGCGAKFTTALGYQMHVKTCGVKEDEREKFTCEICGKTYISMPGLSYHLKAKHIQSEPVDHDHLEQQNDVPEATDPEATPSGRARRKAASRAMSKVHQLAIDHDLVETKSPKKDQQAKNDKMIKKAELDQLLTTLKGREVSKEQEDRWTETLKAELNVPCPCKECSETFTSVSSIKEHLKTCEKAFSYKCLACSKVFLSRMFARNHIKYWHVGYAPAGKDMSDSSDVDFKAISSEESEEDEDSVEVEEIEDSGTDMGEDVNEADEIYVWDNKRKKYRKSKQTTKRPPPAYAYIGTVGGKNSAAYKATEKWRQEAHKHKKLFPNLGPSVSYWSIVDSSEIEQYVPEEPMSPQFTIRRKQEGREKDVLQLPLFGSSSKDDSPVYGDVTFNVGGPVWAMDWCPVPDFRDKEEQFIAISAHRSMDQVHSIHKTMHSKGLIQLWNVGKLMVNSASSGSTPTLSLGIAHNYGAIWDISWCPSGTWEPKSSNKDQSDGLSRLGVMAVACSDGLVRILSIPCPSELFHSLQSKQSDTYSLCPPVIVHAVPHVVLMPCALGAAYDGQCGQAWSVKWCPHSMHEKIATGFSDGTVAIWNLLTESRLLKGSVDDGGQTFRLAPFIHIMTNLSVVRSLAWCPENPNIFATASYDRCYKLWNLKTPYMPITTVRRGQSTELHWSVSFGTMVSSEDDCFQAAKFPSIVRRFSFIGERATTHSTVHNSTIWTVHVSDWSKLLVSADAAGEVAGLFLRSKYNFKFGIYRVYLEKRDDAKSPQQKEVGTAGNQDEDVSVLSEERNGDISKEKNDALPLRTTKQVLQQHKLVFHDVNAIEFTKNINRSDPDVKRLSNPLSMQNTPYDSLTNPEAIHKVRFNPNKQAFTWLASGGAAGLTRLHLIKQVEEK